MREFIEAQYDARIVQFGEPDDEGFATFSAFMSGEFVVAPSLALLISALQERERRPLMLTSAPLRLAA